MGRDVHQIIKELRNQGWRVEPSSGGKHWIAYPPDPKKRRVVMPSTPGRGRWKANQIAQLRRSGFRWGRHDR